MSKYLVILHDAQDSSQVGREELKLRLAEGLGVSEPVVARLLDSLPVILRRDLDFDVAKRYADTLEGLGAVVEAIEQVDGVTDELLRSTPSFLETEKAPSKAKELDLSDLKLAPEEPEPGEDLSSLEDMLEDALHGTGSKVPSTPEAVKSEPVKVGDLVLRFEDEPEEEPEAAVSSENKNSTSSGLSLLQEMTSATEIPSETEAPAPIHDGNEGEEIDISAAFQRYEPSEETVVPEHNPAPTPKKKPKKYAFWAMGVLVLLCPLLLVSRSTPSTIIKIDVDALLRQQNSILNGDSKPQQAAERKITGQWVGDSNENGIASHLRGLEIDNEISFVKLELSTPQPAALSEQEFASGVAPRIWIRKFETNNLKRVEKEGTIAFAGQGRAFIEQGSTSERVLAEFEMEISHSESAPNNISARWILRRNHTGDGEAVAKRLPKGDLELYLSGRSSAQKQALEEPKQKKKTDGKDPHPKAAK